MFPVDQTAGPDLAQMWLAKAVLALHGRSMKSIFQGWCNLICYRILYEHIRQYSRTNKRNRLEAFLREGARSTSFAEATRSVPTNGVPCLKVADNHLVPNENLMHLFHILGLGFMIRTFSNQNCPHFRSCHLVRMPCMKLRHQSCGLPSIISKALAPELAILCLGSLVECQAPQAPDEWTAGWLHFIPTPGKPSTKPQARRPICLHPVCKVASNFVPI